MLRLLFILVLSVWTVSAERRPALLLTEVLNDRISIYSKDGQRIWDYSVRKPVDAWPTEWGTVWVTFNGDKKGKTPGGIREVNRLGETLFEYLTQGEVMSCQPLPTGNVAVAECTMGRVTEVNRQGQVVRSFDLKAKGMGHQTVRHIRGTQSGTILACEKYSHAVREYDWTGTLLREIHTEYPFTAQKLDDGHLLVSHYHNPRVVEFDATGQIVWSVTPRDLSPNLGIDHFCDLTVLEEGAVLLANATKISGAETVTVLAISRDKKVLWTLSDSQNTQEVTAAKPLTEPWLKEWNK